MNCGVENKLTHLDLFSGIGGFALAAQWNGFETIAFSEIDPYASKVLEKHWPNVPNLGDIRTADWTVYRDRVGLLTGGFPCQPFSCAGKRAGKSDDRYLWPSMLHVIETVRPTWCLCENVPGIINMELDAVCSDLENAGYEVQPLVIPACAVDAKHRRDRVWILANIRFKYGISWRNNSERESKEWSKETNNFKRSSQDVANCNSEGLSFATSTWVNCVHSENESFERRKFSGTNAKGRSNWTTEPELGRVANGIPNRVHRLKCLGNAIVPQVASEIIRCMIST